ncbi:MAG: protein kinase [Planctomycetes bacterium]|nr:protein kinase [Planctomycetota bacterium]
MDVPDKEKTESPSPMAEERTLIEPPGGKPSGPSGGAFDVSGDGGLFFTAHKPGGPQPLSRLADYEIIKEIGRGGMGIVFQARHVHLGRVVALKMILGGSLAQPEDIQRFKNEAAAAGQLQHSGIVTLYEVGAHENQPFFSMEYVSGNSLSQRVAVGPLPSRKAAAYLEAVARAVQYAHSRGIIHRDLKPANILLDDNDQPKITDFGLAKLVATDSDQTRTGAVLGTPSYMSPEQANGRKDLGPATDIYSLGAILYELLTGKPPFRGETPLATLTLVAEQEPIPPRLLNPEADRDLETICLKCLEKDPRGRYATSESLADDLRHYMSGEPISARRLNVAGRALKWCRRKPALAMLLFLMVVAPLSFTVFFYLSAQEEKRLRQESANRQKGMRFLLYDADVRRAYQFLEDGDWKRVEKILDRIVKLEEQPEPLQLRDWEWYFLHERLKGRFAMEAHEGRANAVVYSPDGKFLASAGGEPAKPGEIKIWRTSDGQQIALFEGHSDGINSLAYNHDGTLLASGSFDRTVKIWDVASQKELITLKGHSRHVWGVAFSSKGILASAGGDSSIRLWDYAAILKGEKNAVKVLKTPSHEVRAVAFAPAGDLLASAEFDGMVRLWDMETGTEKDALKGHEGEVHALAFSPAGKLLASGGGRGTKRGEVKFWETDTGKLRFSRYGLSDRVLSLAFSKDGKLAAGGSDGLIRVWDQALSSEAATVRGDAEVVFGVAFSPDGQHFASAGKSGRLVLFNTGGGMETHRLDTPGQMEALAFSPKARLLACAGAAAGDPGEIRLFNLDDSGKMSTLRGSAGRIDCLAFSPDGKFLAAAGFDKVVRIYDLTRPQTEPVLYSGHEGGILSVAFHPEGDRLASAGVDHTVRVWNLKTGAAERVLTGHGNWVNAVAFSPDGKLIASGSTDMAIKIWNVETGESRDLLGHKGVVNSIAFSPDGSTLASCGSDRTIRIWNLAAGGRLQKTLETSAKVLSVAFHPNGRRLVSAGQDKIVRLWDVVTGQEILELEDTVGNVRAVAFSADGRHLAAAGFQVCRIWDAIKEWRKFPTDADAADKKKNDAGG